MNEISVLHGNDRKEAVTSGATHWKPKFRPSNWASCLHPKLTSKFSFMDLLQMAAASSWSLSTGACLPILEAQNQQIYREIPSSGKYEHPSKTQV